MGAERPTGQQAGEVQNDISPSKREETATPASDARRRLAELEATIASMPDAVVVYGPSGELSFMNSAAEEMFGYSDEQRRLPFEERIRLLGVERPEGGPLPAEEMPGWRALRGEQMRGVMAILHPPTGKRVWVSMGAAPVRLPGGELLGAVSSFADITSLREFQERREEYILGISDDLRTPLTVVQGRSQLLLRALEEGEPTNRELGSAAAIVTAARQMSAMIRDLVDTAYMDSGQPLKLNLTELDLGQFVWRLRDQLSGALQTKRIQVEAAEGLTPVRADPDRLERILMKLLSNALKYSDQDTKVTLSVRERDGELVTLVSHQGQRMRPEEVGQLFERRGRGTSAREPREGVGSGLYMAKELVEAHGGRIWAESQWGGTTSVIFALPAMRTDGS